MPLLCGVSPLASERSSSLTERSPAAAFCCCAPAWSRSSFLVCAYRFFAWYFASTATFLASSFAVSTT